MNFKIINKYKWYRNPIKWYQDRKKIQLMQILAESYFKQNNTTEEISKMVSECLIYGTAVSKNGIRINYEDFIL